MGEWWHRLEHRFGQFYGCVVSITTPDGRVLIGFQCNKCGLITGVTEWGEDRLASQNRC